MCEDRYYIHPHLDPKEYKRIIYDPGLVTRIILNRPRYLNTSSHALLAELEDAFDRASQDENCNVIVVSGAGRSFCSGDDNIGLTPESAPTLWDGDARSPEDLVKQYGSETEMWNHYNGEHDWWVGGPFHKKMRTIPKPTISMVHGYCIMQGFAIATNMDIVFASEDAMFLGGGAGMSGILTMGPRKALELAYEHRFITAREAHELGLINRVFPDFETLEKETMAFAYRIADESPIALRNAKAGFLNAMEILGISIASELSRTPYRQTWRNRAIEGHRSRYEGKGRARAPVALANLKLKLLSEGEEVPENVEAAITRARERDDRATWQKALHQGWRASDRVGRTEASAKAYEEYSSEHERRKREECERRGLSYDDMLPGMERVKADKF